MNNLTVLPGDGEPRREGRVPPNNLEAEYAVVGSILLDAESIGQVVEFLTPQDFYRESNGQIYRAALDLYREGDPVDFVMLAERLEGRGVLERIGGRTRLAELQGFVPTAANIEHYGRIVKDHAYKRRLITVASQVAAIGFDEALGGDEAVNQAQGIVYAVSDDRTTGGLRHVFDQLKPAMQRIDAQMAGQGEVVGIASGFQDLDRLTNGFKASDLVIVGGRPSMGKTSLAIQVAMDCAVNRRVPVAIFSLEMSIEQVVERMLCTEAKVDSQRLHRGMLGEAEYERLTTALGPIGDAPIYIDDTPTLDDLTLRLKARQAKSRHDIGLVVVDYLQLMQGRGRRDDGNRVQEVSAISRALKSIARELRVPVIAVSQLSRALESRTDKRPILSDLRESGSIEQDADLVAFLYRDEYYNKATERPGVAEVIIAKHRNGPTGSVDLLFRKECTRFESLERRHGGPQ